MVKANVLVVEDEVIVARTIVNQLKKLGYTVVAQASSASQALAKAIETKPDLVLIDIWLKGKMDGIHAAEQIRQELSIPVVYLTACADNDTLQRAKITQPCGYVLRPFSEKDLRVAIEIALYQHRMEYSLQESQEKLATILQSMNDGVIATDNQGIITFINPAAEALTNWHKYEAVGKPVKLIFQIIEEVVGTPIENPVLQVLRGKEFYPGDYHALNAKNGNKIPIGYTASPLKQKSGEIRGVVIVFWDISERRQTKALERALAKERELSSFRSQFISTVSHEFRTPLSTILTAVELLVCYDKQATKKQKQSYLHRIKKAAQRMTKLMDDVLVMGQATSGRLEVVPAYLNLEQFCCDLVTEILLIEAQPNRINFKIQGDCREVWMDERLLSYILTNLLSNALKYSPVESKIEFELKGNAEAQVAIFSIRDEGIGINTEEQSQIFESFYRGKNVGSIAGTGLGLAIVKRCVDQLQGEIMITSTVGVGSKFTVKLPINKSF